MFHMDVTGTGLEREATDASSNTDVAARQGRARSRARAVLVFAVLTLAALMAPQLTAGASAHGIGECESGWSSNWGGSCENGSPKGITATKTAVPSYTLTYKWAIEKSVAQPVINSSGAATAHYTVKVTHDAGTESAWHVTGEIKVTNSYSTTVKGVNVTELGVGDSDAVCKVESGTNLTIPASSSVTLQYSCTYSEKPDSSTQTNTVEVKWPSQGPCSGGLVSEGHTTATAPVEWSKVVPTIIDGAVKGSDTIYGSLGEIKAGEAPKTFNYEHTFSEDPAGTCTTHENVATIKTSTTGTEASAHAQVKHCVGADLKVGVSASGTFKRTDGWTIHKSASPTEQSTSTGSAKYAYEVTVAHDSGTNSSYTLSGKVTVKNPNTWEAVKLTGVTVAVDNGGTCHITSGEATASVPASGEVQLGYECTYAGPPTKAAYNVTAKASWEAAAASTPQGSAEATASGEFSSPTTVVDGSASVNDSLKGSLGTFSAEETSPKVLKYEYEFSGDPAGQCTTHENIATLETSTTKTKMSASANVKHCVGADLTASVNSKPSFTRTYHWTINKTASPGEQTTSGPATFGYKVTVAHDGGLDSAWQVTGDATVKNPNAWESVTLTGVTVTVNNGGSCRITSGSPTATLPAGGEEQLGYECTYAVAPSPSGFTVTAQANWSAAAAHTPQGSAQGTSAGEFSAPSTIVNGSAKVSDSMQGSLGTVLASEPSPKVFEYSREFASDPAGQCTTHENIATLTPQGGPEQDVQPPLQANASVKHCVLGANLKASLDGQPSFTRTYGWSLQKTASPEEQTTEGQSAIFHYKVTASHDAGTDSAWAVTGTATVKNPNGWAVTLSGVTVKVNDGGTCQITSGNPTGAVPANGEAQLGYECTYASAPSPSAYTATAEATWDAATSFTPDGSAQGNTSGEFNAPTTTVNGTVKVTDSLEGTETVLGTIGAGEPSPKVFEYEHEFTGDPVGQCTTHENIATLTAAVQETQRSVAQLPPIEARKTVTHCVERTADLSLQKTAKSASVFAGEDLSWQLTVHNAGPSTAETPTVTDKLPAGTTFVSASAGCTESAGTVTCHAADLPAGGSTEFTITALVGASFEGSKVINEAEVTSPTHDGNKENNHAKSETPVEHSSKILMVKNGPSSVITGEPITWQVTVTGEGPSTATGVKWEDPLPASVEYTGSSTDKGTCALVVTTVVCEIGDLAPGETVHIEVHAKVLAEAGTIVNTAHVTAKEGTESPKSKPSAKTAIVHHASVTITKKVNHRIAAPGALLQYRIVVHDSGPAPARNVRVCDRLPAGISVLEPDGGHRHGKSLCWSIPTLGVGQSHGYSIKVRIDAKTRGTVHNVAVAEGSNFNRVSASANTRVKPKAKKHVGVTG